MRINLGDDVAPDLTDKLAWIMANFDKGQYVIRDIGFCTMTMLWSLLKKNMLHFINYIGVKMQYYIEGVYYREAGHYCRLEQEWRRTKPQISFKEWLTEQSGGQVLGNFEDGWIIKFFDEERYTWFLLKWAGESRR